MAMSRMLLRPALLATRGARLQLQAARPTANMLRASLLRAAASQFSTATAGADAESAVSRDERYARRPRPEAFRPRLPPHIEARVKLLKENDDEFQRAMDQARTGVLSPEDYQALFIACDDRRLRGPLAELVEVVHSKGTVMSPNSYTAAFVAISRLLQPAVPTLVQLLRDMRSANVPPTAADYAKVIRQAGREDRTRVALGLFDEAKEAGLRSIGLVNAALSVMVNARLIGRAIGTYNSLTDMQLVANVGTICHMLRVLTYGGKWNMIDTLLDHASKLGVLQPKVFATLVQAMAESGRTGTALSHYQKAVASGMANADVHKEAIVAAVRSRNSQAFDEVLRNAESAPDAAGRLPLSDLLQTLCDMRGSLPFVTKLVEHMRSQGLRVSPRGAQSLVVQALATGDSSLAWPELEERLSDGSAVHSLYPPALALAELEGNAEQVASLEAAIKEKGVFVGPGLARTVLGALSRNNPDALRSARRLFALIPEDHRDTGSTNAFLQALLSNRRFEEVSEFVANLQRAGEHMSPATFQIALRAAGALGQADRVQALMEQAEEAGAAHESLYSTAAQAFARANQPDKIRAVLQRMSDKGVRISPLVELKLNAQACVESGEADRAVEMVAEASKKHVPLPARTDVFRYLVNNALATNNADLALELAQRVRDCGVMLDRLITTRLVKTLVASGRLPDAEAALRDLRAVSTKSVGRSAYGTLTQALEAAGKKEEASRIRLLAEESGVGIAPEGASDEEGDAEEEAEAPAARA